MYQHLGQTFMRTRASIYGGVKTSAQSFQKAGGVMTSAKSFLQIVKEVELLHNLKTGGGEKTVIKRSVGPLIVRH